MSHPYAFHEFQPSAGNFPVPSAHSRADTAGIENRSAFAKDIIKFSVISNED